jgi:centromere protein S
MPGLQEDDETKNEKLKAALWYSIGEMVDTLALEQDFNATPHFIGGLAELVWAQIETVAEDLEGFAKHADRQVISTKDVVLLGRHNEGLKGILQSQEKAARDRDLAKGK